MEDVTIDNFELDFDNSSSNDILEELILVRELQVMQINNSIEFFKSSIVFIGLLVALFIGAFFIKVGFKNG